MSASTLHSLCANHYCTVMIGTEKNAGKTTVLNALLEQEKAVVGITGIGRDGESSDIVTGTVKPEIFVKKGTLVATAAGLMKYCACPKRIMATTGINTALGEVVVFRAEEAGFVQIAGPSIVSQLVSVREIFRSLGAKRVYIDGALDRKTFSACALADAAILVTGASSTADMSQAVEKAAFIADSFFYPLCRPDTVLPESGCIGFKDNVRLNEETSVGDKVKKADKEGSDISEDNSDKLIAMGADEIRSAGGLTDKTLAKIKNSKTKLKIILSDPGKILCSPEELKAFLKKGNKLFLLNRPTLAAICTNTFSIAGYRYDPQEYAAAVAKATGLPVFDLVYDIEIKPDKIRK